jgi:hypothetical protein
VTKRKRRSQVPLKTPRQALRFVERQGLVLLSARGPVANLAEAVAGERIRGSWWGHPKGRAIYRAASAVADSKDVAICRLIGGKVTFVHRRLWPALVRLAPRLPKAGLAAIREEHTATGAHRTVTTPFPRWVPPEVRAVARSLSEQEARGTLSPWLVALGLSGA